MVSTLDGFRAMRFIGEMKTSNYSSFAYCLEMDAPLLENRDLQCSVFNSFDDGFDFGQIVEAIPLLAGIFAEIGLQEFFFIIEIYVFDAGKPFRKHVLLV